MIAASIGTIDSVQHDYINNFLVVNTTKYGISTDPTTTFTIGNQTGTSATSGNWRNLKQSPTLSTWVMASRDTDGGVNHLRYSMDGINWENCSSTAIRFYSLIWCDTLNLFVATGSSSTGTGSYVTRSSDGITWSTVNGSSAGLSYGKIYGIAWSSSLGLFCGVSGNRTYTSSDAITWTASSALAGSLYSIDWSSSLGKFCAVGNAGTNATSTNGLTWTFNSTTITEDFGQINWSTKLGLFFASTNYIGVTPYTFRILTSTNGTTWNQRYSNSASYARSVYNLISSSQNDTLVVLMNGNTVSDSGVSSTITSSNGTTWTWNDSIINTNATVIAIT